MKKYLYLLLLSGLLGATGCPPRQTYKVQDAPKTGATQPLKMEEPPGLAKPVSRINPEVINDQNYPALLKRMQEDLANDRAALTPERPSALQQPKREK